MTGEMQAVVECHVHALQGQLELKSIMVIWTYFLRLTQQQQRPSTDALRNYPMVSASPKAFMKGPTIASLASVKKMSISANIIRALTTA